MSGESTMRRRLVKILREQGRDAYPIENMVGVGTPDVEYVGGWIECKKHKAWPKKDTTPLRLGHPLLPSQKQWIRRRAACGGTVHVLIQVGMDFVLLGPGAALNLLGAATKDELIDAADLYCTGWAALGDLIVEAITC